MLTLITTIIVFGILVTIHEWGHFIVAKRQGIQVDVFSIGFGPVLIKKEWRGTLYAISLIPLGGYVKMAGDDPVLESGAAWKECDFFGKTPWQRMKVVMAGPLMNYLLAFVLFSLVFVMGAPTPKAKIGGVLEGFPAEQAGLRSGDTVLAVNGVEVALWDELTSAIQNAPSGDLTLAIMRDEQTLQLAVTPEQKEAADVLGKSVTRRMIGIKPASDVDIIRYSPLKAVVMGAQKLYFVSALTYKSLFYMATGQISMRDTMTGPIGIVMITGESAKKGFVYVLHLMAMLSAALALFNFLPIPVLDGGHFVLYLLELVTGRAVSLRWQEYFQKAGVVFLLGLMVVVFYNDIVNFKLVGKAKALVLPVESVNQNEDKGLNHDSE